MVYFSGRITPNASCTIFGTDILSFWGKKRIVADRRFSVPANT